MEKASITRREFIVTTSLATAGAVIAKGGVIKHAGAVLQAGLPRDMEPWHDRTMRWMQIAFIEGDRGKYDPQGEQFYINN